MNLGDGFALNFALGRDCPPLPGWPTVVGRVRWAGAAAVRSASDVYWAEAGKPLLSPVRRGAAPRPPPPLRLLLRCRCSTGGATARGPSGDTTPSPPTPPPRGPCLPPLHFLLRRRRCYTSSVVASTAISTTVRSTSAAARPPSLPLQPNDAVTFTVAKHDGAGIDELATDDPREVAKIASLVLALPQGGAVLTVQATVLLRLAAPRSLALGVTVHHAACDSVSTTHSTPALPLLRRRLDPHRLGGWDTRSTSFSIGLHFDDNVGSSWKPPPPPSLARGSTARGVKCDHRLCYGAITGSWKHSSRGQARTSPPLPPPSLAHGSMARGVNVTAWIEILCVQRHNAHGDCPHR
ncbi:quercetin 3-O-glucoside-6''-O-malonyltransferase-like [Oryza sativa Japonica Group]|uniref:Quercetin 3-O-glucoside-6''-O-malonyltransferase-like n=1 Tax=Oryza sativa subsp. japonica TaxID=39947 RepID=Q5ZCG9_ORYSJ|nr:quercetin 3-O-glucoside-6''-O-malonyltransferase-like [Oryza sativa Japonica Group]